MELVLNKRLSLFGLTLLFSVAFLLLILSSSAHFSRAQGPSPTPTAPPDFEGASLPAERGHFFVGAGACTNCHTNMVDESGADVSVDSYWQSTMMANAARDPYWQAAVRIETTEFPQLRTAIEDKCATCHMPMARFALAAEGKEAAIFDDGLLDPEHPLHALAMDGNSCTLCHQIQDANLGQPESFSGGFVIDTEQPMGERVVYSQFEVPEDLATMMQGASGFAPAQSDHITQSELCASCHTLYTNTVSDDGDILGQFPEQVPYFEWLNSDFRDSASCQDCHMPVADGGVVTSITGGPPRSPFSKHTFVGGNAYMMQIFRTFGAEMDVTASSEDFDNTYQRTVDQLRTRTATIEVDNTSLTDSELSFDVVINVQTGHKFPTAYPSRRAWLHVLIVDASGEIVFESGAFESNGRIMGDNHDADPTQFEPHYTEISEPDQVQIYESVLMDTQGRVTTTLLRGAGYVKDNRLLPPGFDKQSAQDDIAVRGQALDDVDFVGGGDTVRYVLEVGDAEGPYTVTVELLYQSIAFNWAEKVREYDDDESKRFTQYYDAVPNVPVVVHTVTAELFQ